MVKGYLKKVASVAEYNAFKAGAEFVTPNVTLVGDKIQYNPVAKNAE